MLSQIETMLNSEPPKQTAETVGVTSEALVAWRRMGPLRLEKIASHAFQPLAFDEMNTVYREWADEQDCRCYGQVNRVSNKPEGIVRKVTKQGYIYEGQYKDG